MAIKQLEAKSKHMSQTELEKMNQEEREVLEMIAELDPRHPHLIEVFAVIERDGKTCFMFPWANGGNLRDLWDKEDPTDRSIEWTKWAIDQLLGLSEAISRLHHLDEDRNCRHGDLKPENILCFKGEQGTQGKLVIADVGLAKVHTNPTFQRANRHILTVAMSGTQRYEPPDLLDKVARSRVYDIWSLGCICLEFIIWLLYNTEGLHRFNDEFINLKFWWAPERAVDSIQARLEGKVFRWMKWIRANDTRAAKNTALGDLLDLVQDRLLVIRVERTGKNVRSPDFRAQSQEVCEVLASIKARATRDPPYLTRSTDAPVPTLRGPRTKSGAHEEAPRQRIGESNLRVPGQVPATADRNRAHQQDNEGVQSQGPFPEIRIETTVSC